MSVYYVDFGIFFVCSDWEQLKYQGLSYFFFDMWQFGVEVRLLWQMNGYQLFNEVFMMDVEVLVKDFFGGEGNGWVVVMMMFLFECRGFSCWLCFDVLKVECMGLIYVEFEKEFEMVNELYIWYLQCEGCVDFVFDRVWVMGVVVEFMVC